MSPPKRRPGRLKQPAGTKQCRKPISATADPVTDQDITDPIHSDGAEAGGVYGDFMGSSSLDRLPFDCSRPPPAQVRKARRPALAELPDLRACGHEQAVAAGSMDSANRFDHTQNVRTKSEPPMPSMGRACAAACRVANADTNPTARNVRPLRPTHWRTPPPPPPVPVAPHRAPAPDACAGPRDTPGRCRMEQADRR